MNQNQKIEQQNEAIAKLVLEVAAEKQRADMLLEQAQHAAAAVQAEQQRYEALAQELAAAKAAIPAQTGIQSLEWDAVNSAANTANNNFGQWMPERWLQEFVKAYNASIPAQPVQQPVPVLSADDVEWVTNDNAELGIKIGNQFFFLYKGHSLVYESGLHDDGRQMMYRPVFKREFGECAHPINHNDYSKIGTVSLSDSDEWKAVAAAPVAAPVDVPAASVQPELQPCKCRDGGGCVSIMNIPETQYCRASCWAPNRGPAAAQLDIGRDAAKDLAVFGISDAEAIELIETPEVNAAFHAFRESMGVTTTIKLVDAIVKAHAAAHPANVAQPVSDAALADYGYQQLFDAIAAATKIEGNSVSISVKAFRAALATHPAMSAPADKEGQ